MIGKLILIVFFLFFLYVSYMSKRFDNPYKLVMIWGKKGSGKTTLAAKLAQKHIHNGQLVFSNAEIYGTYFLDPKDIGYRQFPVNSVVIVDEASLIWDNRNFKSFDQNIGRWFRLQRQSRVTTYLLSQNFDIDKKLRDLCDEMFLCQNLFGFLTVAKKIRKIPKLHKASKSDDGSKQSEGFITEDYRYYFITSWIWTYIPRYIKFFSSFSPDPLPPVHRRKYVFDQDLYLWRYQDYVFYKVEQLKSVVRWWKSYMKTKRTTLSISEDRLLNLIEVR